MTQGVARSLVVVSLAAVGLGAVSAGVTTTLLMSRQEESRLPAAIPEPRAGAETPAEIRELRERLAVLESTPAPVPAVRRPAGEFASKEDFEAFREEIRGWLDQRNVAAPGTPELKDHVADALSSIRLEEALTKARRAQEANAARMEERVGTWSGWLGLDDHQAGELRTIFTDKDERDRELLRLWEAGADDEVLTEVKGSNNQGFYDAVEGLLTPEQLATFQTKFGEGDG